MEESVLEELTFVMMNPIQTINDVFSILGMFWGSCWLLITLGLALLFSQQFKKILYAAFDYVNYRRYYKRRIRFLEAKKRFGL